jgi:hypothetical protein
MMRDKPKYWSRLKWCQYINYMNQEAAAKKEFAALRKKLVAKKRKKRKSPVTRTMKIARMMAAADRKKVANG